jgi:soluble lytic murein transglycosylase
LIKKVKKMWFIFLLIIILLVAAILTETAAKSMFPLKYSDYVLWYSKINSIDPYLVFSVIKAESGFNSTAVSKKNARGLMQISEKTGRWGAESLKIDNYNIELLFDPEINIMIGCWYLNNLMQEFNNNTDLVIAAYNGGSGNVRKWLNNKDYSISGEKLEKIPFGETRRYLNKVKRYCYIYKKLYGGT